MFTIELLIELEQAFEHAFADVAFDLMRGPQDQDTLAEAEHTVSHRKPHHDEDAVGQIGPDDATRIDVVDDDS